ncbi:MAG: hypothetical protein E7K47_05575, partial [Acidovorax sp.]|nr:hypothetical protein [Acidovorax sp.]
MTNTAAGAKGGAVAACYNGSWSIESVTECSVNLPTPSSISATDGTITSKVQVNWASISGATGYRLQYRAVGQSSWTTVNNVSSGWQHSTNEESIFEYQVQAFNSLGSGDWSAVDTGFIRSPIDAKFISQSAPKDVKAGTEFQVQQTWENNGEAIWDSTYALGLSSGSYDFVTRSNTFPGSVASNATVSTVLSFIAPSAPGTYELARRLTRDGKQYGQNSPRVSIRVWGDPICSALSVNKTYLYSTDNMVAAQFTVNNQTTGQTASVWNETAGLESAKTYTPTSTGGVYRFDIPLADHGKKVGKYRVKIDVSNAVASGACETTFDLIHPPVSDLHATDGTLDDVVRVTWGAPANLTGSLTYNVFRDGVLIQEGVNLRSIDDVPPERGKAYLYRVVPILNGDHGEPSENYGHLPACRAADGPDQKWDCVAPNTISAESNLMIPAIDRVFKRSGNRSIIETSALKMRNGSVVTGSYPVHATLHKNAQIALVVNGVTINPGETKTVIAAHNFDTSGGRISLPVMPAQANALGSGNLLISAGTADFPIVGVSIGTWTPAVEIKKDTLQVVQGIQPVSVKVTPATGSRCRVSGFEMDVMSSDVITDPACLIQWDKLPEGVEPLNRPSEVELVGQIAQVGEHEISYSLFMFDAAGQKVQVGGGKEIMIVTSAMGAVTMAPTSDVSQVLRLVQDLSFRISQVSGPDCAPTLNEQLAKSNAQNRSPGVISRQCFFEWLEMPDGLAQDTLNDFPQVQGALIDRKTHDLKWRVSLFTRTGEKVVLNEQTYTMDAVDPPPPVVELASKHQLEGSDVVVVPMSEIRYGVANISAERSLLDISVSRGVAQAEVTTVKPARGANITRTQHLLQAEPEAAWTQRQHKVLASYNKLPEVFTEKALTVYLAPSLNVKPAITVESPVAIDSVPYPVRVSMFDRTKANEPYDEAKMGKWKVRLIREMAYNKSEPLTEFVDATDGAANFNVDLSKLDATSMRFNVEAVLESPVEGYARTEKASRSTLVSIVRGGLIEGTITGTRLSGQAPFRALLKLALKDTKNARYTGDVTWEVSVDGGVTWEVNPVAQRYKYQLARVYELGVYKVRAKITNAHSGVTGYTEAVEVVAYDKPKAQIVGARAHFVGAEAKLQAQLKSGNKALNPDDYIVEWSLDGGASFTVAGPELVLQRDEPKHLTLVLRAKPKEAPEKDSSAYHMVRSSLDFLPVKPPRPFISGPLRMEKGKAYTFVARTTMPYHGMGGEVKGVFTLPNGEQVEGDTATYTPTDEDLKKEYVETKYTAWIEGFREAGAESTTSARSRTWEYIFPNFGMEIRRTASVAPATITAILRPIGFNGRLEEPTYEWNLPEGSVVLEQRPTLRV